MRALLVIDMQNACVFGETPRRDPHGTIERINALAAALRDDGRIVFIQHTDPDDGYAHGSHGWELLPSLAIAPEDRVVAKTACDAFLESGLKEILDRDGVDELVVVGCATDFCVDTTVRSAAALGYRVTVARDAHTTGDRPHLDAGAIIDHHHFMWEGLILPRGERIRLASSEEILAATLSSARSSRSDPR